MDTQKKMHSKGLLLSFEEGWLNFDLKPHLFSLETEFSTEEKDEEQNTRHPAEPGLEFDSFTPQSSTQIFKEMTLLKRNNYLQGPLDTKDLGIWKVGLYRPVLSAVSVGPEAGMYLLQSPEYSLPGQPLSEKQDYMLYMGGAVKVGPRYHLTRPYIIGALGYYNLRSGDSRIDLWNSSMGASFGGGIQLQAFGLALQLEGRLHQNLEANGMQHEFKTEFFTLMLGISSDESGP